MIMTDDQFSRFKKKFNEAKKEKKKEFEFQDQPVLVSYAKYLIIYNEDFRKVRK